MWRLRGRIPEPGVLEAGARRSGACNREIAVPLHFSRKNAFENQAGSPEPAESPELTLPKMIFDYDRVFCYVFAVTPFLDQLAGVTALAYGDRRAHIGTEVFVMIWLLPHSSTSLFGSRPSNTEIGARTSAPRCWL